MTGTLPFLNDLPSHIILQIAQLTGNERTIWNMMGSSRALRETAEAALKPYLAEREVTGDPPFITDIFEPIDLKFAQSDRARGLLLSKLSDRLDNFFQAYPLALTLIRELILEIDDFSSAPGWKILHRASSHLTSLEVHVEDILWRYAVEFEPHGDDGRSAIIETAMGSAEIWETAFDGNKRSKDTRLMASVKDSDSTLFPNLTTLVMATQARGGEHLARFLKFAPNLRVITLSCHFRGVYDMDQPELLSLGSYPKLERLTLAGHGVLLINILKEMGPLSPNLGYLVTSISDEPDDDTIYDSAAAVVMALAQCRALKGLAVYGPDAKNITRMMAYLQDKGMVKAGVFSRLKRVVIEQSDRAYLLSDPAAYQPPMPILERIVWVDRKWNKHSKTRMTMSSPTQHALDVDKLFSRYPKLQSVRWVSNYPQDPFNGAEVDRITNYTMDRDGREAES